MTEAEAPLVAVRPYDALRDAAFVRASWVKSFEGSSLGRSLGGHYLSRWTAVVDELLARSTVLVATSPDDPDLLLGFACAEPARGVLHYVFTKSRFRQHGVAQELVAALFTPRPTPLTFTHRTETERAITAGRGGLAYDFTRIWLP